MNDKILQDLSKPFAPASISWLPGSITKDKTKALALAYADLRAYMNRLDEVCGLGWSVSYTPWANKLICHLTIEGVTRSSVGEPTDESEKGEIDGTVTEAQAFKRACVMFGLGRYLYNFPQSWQPIDEYKKFTKEAQQKLAKMVADHYQRSLDTIAQAQHRPARPPQDVSQNVSQNVSRETLAPADDELDDINAEDSTSLAFDVPAPKSSGPVVWPYDEDALAYMLQHSPVYTAMPELSVRLVNFLVNEDDASQEKRLSEKQYGLLAGKLDAKYGNGSHRAILSVLCKRVVTGEDAPGWKTKVLIDWLMKESDNAQKIQALDGAAIALREALQVA